LVKVDWTERAIRDLEKLDKPIYRAQERNPQN